MSAPLENDYIFTRSTDPRWHRYEDKMLVVRVEEDRIVGKLSNGHSTVAYRHSITWRPANKSAPWRIDHGNE